MTKSKAVDKTKKADLSETSGHLRFWEKQLLIIVIQKKYARGHELVLKLQWKKRKTGDVNSIIKVARKDYKI